jgi:FixJ family two-component response regulator
VVLSSGYSEQEATQRFTGKGLTGFIQKPYRYDDLIDKMNEVLGE